VGILINLPLAGGVIVYLSWFLKNCGEGSNTRLIFGGLPEHGRAGGLVSA